MPTISSAGIGSGIDVNGLVEQLVAAEGAPVKKRLDRKEAELQAGLSAMGTFKGAVSEFQASLAGLRDSETFNAIKANAANEGVVSVSASNQAQTGEYDLEVIELANAHKVATDTFDSANKFFGSGRITLQLGAYDSDSNTFQSNPDNVPVTIDIDPDKASLRDIAVAINDSEAPIRASVMNDGNGYRMVLSAEQPGSDNSIRVQVEDSDGNDGDLSGLSNLALDPIGQRGRGNNLQQVAAASDARVRVEGIDIQRASNDFEDVIPGVSFSLQPGAAGSSTRLDVQLESRDVVAAIEGFVKKYNEMIQVVEQLTGFDPETEQAGPLSGDASIRGVVSMLRREIGTDFSGINEQFPSLGSIGIETNRDGTLTLNSGRLQQAIASNRQEVVNLFARAGSADDPGVTFLAAGEATEPGAYDLDITRPPARGVLNGRALMQEGPLVLNDADNRLSLRVDGIASGALSLEPGTYNALPQLATRLEAAINSDPMFKRNDVEVSVRAEQGRLQILSASYGSNSRVELTDISPSLSRITGLAPGKGESGENVAGRLGSLGGRGNGRQLEGMGPVEGLTIQVEGNQTGNRGQVIFSNGVAARLDQLLGSVLDEDGILTVRSEGFNERLQSIGEEREKLARRLAETEERYMKEFTAMDATVGKMKATSKYLSQQLGSLPGATQGNSKGPGNS
ncbi:flagellar filament capping protein FliD [Thiohalophilus sp.]|uniref:flagellar filament capping protein FliD n=1 Tax=Thiohalophilus sp. TaxID=3028392 RepID=UPI002ACD9672|nr:flagellar filament capping protein FliD [Thiohalophilus sp.]MDZ7802627.1 flagellar filament capping protein FliD [Thiohalophilus sp.]